jgi:hypothetical protein
MKFLKEIAAKGDHQNDLKTSDGSDAGKSDLVSKPVDIKFSLMRNMINTQQDVITGSKVNNFLEKAHELNDEIDSVPYAVQTDNGEIIKIYVNAIEADDFEKALGEMLGIDNDVETAINTLAQKFDIIDVVWPDKVPADEDDETVIDTDSMFSDDDDNEEPKEDGFDEDALTTPTQENDMSNEKKEYLHSGIGNSFLKRITESEDDVVIKDTAWKGIYSRLKRPYEKKIVQLFQAIGIPGRIAVREEGLEDNIQSAADMLRRAGRKQSLFNIFFDTFTSKGEVSESLTEAKTPWQVLTQIAKTSHGEFGFATLDADDAGKYVYMSMADKIAEKEFGEFGLLTLSEPQMKKLLNAHPELLRSTASKLTEAKKRGGRVQKILETVLVNLGLPESLTTTEGAGILASVFSKAAAKISANSDLEAVLTQLAKALGITTAEINESLDEEVDIGSDEYMQLVMTLCAALGIPERNLQYQNAQVIKSLRTKKMALSGRGMIEQRMAALTALITKNTRDGAKKDDMMEHLILEAFGSLEALTKHDLRHYNMFEPEGGPAMMAPYDTKGAHEDSFISVGVDPEIVDDNKSLIVKIDSPWQEDPHFRSFPNTKAGYKSALDYAEKLRTHSPKTGGRPKGWKS